MTEVDVRLIRLVRQLDEERTKRANAERSAAQAKLLNAKFCVPGSSSSPRTLHHRKGLMPASNSCCSVLLPRWSDGMMADDIETIRRAGLQRTLALRNARRRARAGVL